MSKYDREFLADLACFLEPYRKEIRDHIIDEAEHIYADSGLRRLLHEHRIRVDKRREDFLEDLNLCLNLGFMKPGGESALLHSGSYNDVLNDLLIAEWWRGVCEEKESA